MVYPAEMSSPVSALVVGRVIWQVNAQMHAQVNARMNTQVNTQGVACHAHARHLTSGGVTLDDVSLVGVGRGPANFQHPIQVSVGF